jgi:hypothetical protein
MESLIPCVDLIRTNARASALKKKKKIRDVLMLHETSFLVYPETCHVTRARLYDWIVRVDAGSDSNQKPDAWACTTRGPITHTLAAQDRVIAKIADG